MTEYGYLLCVPLTAPLTKSQFDEPLFPMVPAFLRCTSSQINNCRAPLSALESSPSQSTDAYLVIVLSSKS